MNECATNNGGCNVNADCVNTPGSRTCNCKPGFVKQGNGAGLGGCLREWLHNNMTADSHGRCLGLGCRQGKRRGSHAPLIALPASTSVCSQQLSSQCDRAPILPMQPCATCSTEAAVATLSAASMVQAKLFARASPITRAMVVLAQVRGCAQHACRALQASMVSRRLQ